MYKIGQGVYPSDCESAGVEVGADRTLNCLVDSEGFCISVSWDDISYTATNESLTPVEGSCTLPTFIPDTQIGQMVASDGASDDNYGHSVSISGDTAIIGAPFDDDQGDFSGSAYIFTRSGGSWTQQTKLTEGVWGPGNRFGISVAISGDTAIVGVVNDDEFGTDSGSAYVYTRSGSSWTQQAKLNASDAAASDRFGTNVSIHEDTVIVGAYTDDDKGTDSGSAYIFTRSGSSWTEEAKLTASDGTSSERFGEEVALFGDTAIVGVPRSYGDGGGALTGSAYIFTRSGGSWSQQAKLTKNGAATYDHFGSSIDLSEETAIIGSNGNSAAYIFTRSGGTWTEQDELISSDGASNNFGYSVALSGNTAVIGAHLDGANGPGAAYVFTRSGSEWSQQSKLELGTPYPFTDDYFGINLDMSGDTAIIIANGPYGSSANIFQPSL